MSDDLIELWRSKETPPKLRVVYRRGAQQYPFAQRIGQNSIAFILYDKNKWPKVGLLQEYRNTLGKDLIGAFTGSIDKNKSITEIAREEVIEEAGYTIPAKKLTYIGSKYATNFMDEFIHLFVADISNKKQGKRKPQNEIEEAAQVMWVDKDKVSEKLHDWKSELIINWLEKNRDKIE